MEYKGGGKGTPKTQLTHFAVVAKELGVQYKCCMVYKRKIMACSNWESLMIFKRMHF